MAAVCICADELFTTNNMKNPGTSLIIYIW